MHVYNFFALYSLSYSLSPPLAPPMGANLPSLGRTYFTLLFSDFAEEKREKEKHDIFACLRKR
jgi:hypothetical protein